MKVGLLGNMNNAHFVMTRYLRDRGVDAELMIFDGEMAHFSPSCDSFDLEFRTYCRTVPFGSSTGFSSVSADVIRRHLEPYDFLIGTGLAPALCAKAGVPLDVFNPYGADIRELTKYRVPPPHKLGRVLAPIYYQRKGIPLSRIFHMGLTNSLYEGLADKFIGNATRWSVPMPCVHAPTYDASSFDMRLAKTHWGHEFLQTRERADFMAFCQSRHYWKCTPGIASDKGTGEILKGWAQFVKSNPDLNAQLVTLEYGKDVEASKALVNELGVADSVTWMPLMYRKDLMIGLALADICFGQFGNSWISCGAFFEALVAGTPLLSRRDDALYTDDFSSLYPIFNASNAAEIAMQLQSCLANPDRARTIGEDARRWYEDVIVQPGVAGYMQEFSAASDD